MGRFLDILFTDLNLEDVKMQTTPTTKNHETDRELTAYIYQQLAEMQPYLIPESQMAVTVQHVVPRSSDTASHEPILAESVDELLTAEQAEQEEKDEDKSETVAFTDVTDEGEYVVKLIATLDGGRLEAEGHGSNVYQAFGQAKGSMVQQLNEIHNALMDPTEREQEIQSLLKGERTLH